MALPSETPRLQALMSEVVHCCQDRMVFESRRFNLPQADIKCLMLFSGADQLTVTQVAQGLDVAKSRASNILSNMAERGLVRFDPDPDDGRVKLVSLTGQGKKIAKDIGAFITKIHGAVLARLEPKQRPMVITSLELLKRAMDSIKGQLDEM